MFVCIIQWNLSKPDTTWAEESVPHARVVIGQECVSSVQQCPLYRGSTYLACVCCNCKSINQLSSAPVTTVNIVRLLLSCLHAWNLDRELDLSCEETLGLVRPCRPVSFGLLSKGQCLSLVLPGQRESRSHARIGMGLKRICNMYNVYMIGQ